MAWDGWANACMRTSTGNDACADAWICDLTGQPWGVTHKTEGSTKSFTPQEFQKAYRFLTGTATDDDRTSGIQLFGERFIFIRAADNDHMVCKKGNTGVTIAKANTCCVVGFYDEGMQPGNNTLQVTGVRDLLKDGNY